MRTVTSLVVVFSVGCSSEAVTGLGDGGASERPEQPEAATVAACPAPVAGLYKEELLELSGTCGPQKSYVLNWPNPGGPYSPDLKMTPGCTGGYGGTFCANEFHLTCVGSETRGAITWNAAGTVAAGQMELLIDSPTLKCASRYSLTVTRQ